MAGIPASVSLTVFSGSGSSETMRMSPAESASSETNVRYSPPGLREGLYWSEDWTTTGMFTVVVRSRIQMSRAPLRVEV